MRVASDPAGVPRARVMLAAFAVALLAGDGLVLWHHLANAPHGYQYWLECSLSGTFSAALAAILLARRPGHPFARLAVAAAAVSAAQLTAGALASTATIVTLPRAVAIVAAYVSATAQATIVGVLLLALLVAPTGRLPTRRWLPVVWAIAAMCVAFAFSDVSSPDLGNAAYLRDNPLPSVVPHSVLHAVQTGGAILAGPLILLATVALLSRLWTTSGEARQQVKLVVAAGVAGVTAILVYTVVQNHLPASHQVGSVVWAVAGAAIPAATTASILKYGLYEIDRVVSRTVAYLAVTVLLAAVYLGVVVAAEQMLGASSALAVAASTLAVAALFNPVRRRVQRRVDRRFNRERVDAEQAIERFAAWLRGQVDVDAVTAQLQSATAQALEPVTVSVWLRT